MKKPPRIHSVVYWLGSLLPWAIAAAAMASVPPPPPAGNPGKPASVSTVGPAAPLSAAQHEALEAKRAATLVGPRSIEAATVKAAPISTIPAGAPSVGLKAMPKAAAVLAAPTKPARPAESRTLAQRIEERATIDALIRALGPEMARRAGLIKDSEGGGGAKSGSTSAGGSR